MDSLDIVLQVECQNGAKILSKVGFFGKFVFYWVRYALLMDAKRVGSFYVFSVLYSILLFK